MRLKIACRKAYGFKSHLRHFVKEKQKVIVIVGPTASGKTSLSIQLAKTFNGEVISADSRQVYRGLDLGTGKVTVEEMDGVPHHLLDVADPQQTYTAHEYVHDARNAIVAISTRDKLPIVVGGTFLYIDTLLGNISTPPVAPNVELRAELDTLSTDALMARLEAKDPVRARTIDRNNRRRLVRAIEITETLGNVPETITSEPYETLKIGISISKEALAQNIHTRLVDRLDRGMIAEVEQLHAHGLTHERLDDFGLEYRYISRYLRGHISYEKMMEEIETKSRQYAKRQMTWLKRDNEIVWMEPGEGEKVQMIVRDFLEQNRLFK